jgi:hypothetical protein
MTGELPDGGDGTDHRQHVDEHRPDHPLGNTDLHAGNFRPRRRNFRSQLGPQLRDLDLQIRLCHNVGEDRLGQRLGGAGRLLVGEAGILQAARQLQGVEHRHLAIDPSRRSAAWPTARRP